MEDRLIDKTEEKIKEIIDTDINQNNIDNLYKLTKIRHMVKEDENMNYGNYNGRGPGYDSYGRMYMGDYGRRGYDRKYRGQEQLNRIEDHYGRYEGDKERYGHNEDTKRSLKYMLESVEDFFRMLVEDAQSQEEVEMIRQTAQKMTQM